MSKQINHFYEFGSIKLDATNRLLYKDGKQLDLQPRVVETLLVLVKNPNSVVDKNSLLDAVWQDVFVEEGVLKRNISILRKALGDEGRLIETLPKRGYRFTAKVSEHWGVSPIYGIDDAPAELVVQRKSNLRISQEEELSDSSDSQHAESSVGYKDSHRSSISQNRYLVPVSAAVGLLLAGLVLFWSVKGRGNEAAAAPIRSVAVLPFKNLTAAHGDEAHFGIGIADVLITRLSNIKTLNVRPTSAVMKFNDNEQDPIAAGQILAVDAVLEGSIYRAGDRVRITARLMRVKDQLPVWAGQFDEKTDDILLIQNTLSQQVASSLALNLSRGETDALTKRYTQNADAFQLYVNGRYHWNKRNEMVQAESSFRKAIEKDPNFALAYVGLADTLSMSTRLFNESEYAIRKALELDDKLGEAYASRGFWNTFKAWRWEEAEADFKRAIELNPGYGTAHQWYATLLAITGRVGEAKAEMRRALEIDPTSHNFLADMGQIYYFAREYDEAESYCRKALDMYPNFVFAHEYLSNIYIVRGEDDKAFEEMLTAQRTLSPFLSYVNAEEVPAHERRVREIYRQSGLRGVWRERVKKLYLKEFSNWGLFQYCALLGEKEKALEALGRNYENREFMLPFVNVDPVYDGLRSEPRFKAIFRRMGLGS